LFRRPLRPRSARPALRSASRFVTSPHLRSKGRTTVANSFPRAGPPRPALSLAPAHLPGAGPHGRHSPTTQRGRSPGSQVTASDPQDEPHPDPKVWLPDRHTGEVALGYSLLSAARFGSARSKRARTTPNSQLLARELDARDGLTSPTDLLGAKGTHWTLSDSRRSFGSRAGASGSTLSGPIGCNSVTGARATRAREACCRLASIAYGAESRRQSGHNCSGCPDGKTLVQRKRPGMGRVPTTTATSARGVRGHLHPSGQSQEKCGEP